MWTSAPGYLGVSGDVVVDHAVDVRDVQTSGRHVGGQQDRPRLGLELVERAQTFILEDDEGIRKCEENIPSRTV